ncbi:hypothetical protein C5167_034537, partial [Papaver somniferum]
SISSSFFLLHKPQTQSLLSSPLLSISVSISICLAEFLILFSVSEIYLRVKLCHQIFRLEKMKCLVSTSHRGDSSKDFVVNGDNENAHRPLTWVPACAVVTWLSSAEAAHYSGEMRFNSVYEVGELFELGIQLSYLLLLLGLVGAVFQEQIRSGDASATELFELGAVMLRRKFYPAAIKYLQQAISKWDGDDQDLAQVHNALGVSYIRDEKLEKGINQFETATSRGRLKEDEARKYFQQLINAVDYCRSRGVFHRDLKPENLLLDASGGLKVSDFGLSALPQQVREDGLLHTTCGTPNYVAPEVVNSKGYDGAKADLWSCGVILFVLMAGYLPFEEANIMELYKKVTSESMDAILCTLVATAVRCESPLLTKSRDGDFAVAKECNTVF